MKRILSFFILLIAVWQFPLGISAQTTTPNVGLTIPEYEPGTWGELIANDLLILDSKFPGGQSGHKIQDEAVDLPARSKLNFIGAGVSATDNSGNDRTDVTIDITGAGHTIKDEGTPLTQRTGLNFTGAGVTCTDSAGTNSTICDVPSGSVNTAASFTWTGAHSWRDNNWSLLDNGDTSKILNIDISNFTTATTRTWTGPNATTRLVGESDFGGSTGFFARTGSSTFAARSIASNDSNKIAITNPSGVAGNPTLSLGANVLQSDQSFTAGAPASDYDFGAAASFTFPKATGAAPSSEGRCAQDTTAHRLKCNFGSGVVTLAILSEVQPLNANLTSLASLTGSNNTIPVFTGPATFTLGTMPSCPDSGGNHINYDNTAHTWSCGTSSTGGLSGATTGKYLIATGASTFDTSGNLSQSAGVVNASGGFTIGDVTTNYVAIDPSAVTGAKTWTAQNTSGLIIPCDTVIGNYTDAHVLKVVKVGSIVTCADGGAAGTGTWTDSSTNTGTNKTLRDTLAGGTNTLYTPVRASWDAGAVTPDGANCADPTRQTINSGPTLYTFSCADSNSSTFDGHLTLPITMAANLATVKFRLTVNDVDSSSQVFGGGFKAQCRASGTAPNSTWGTAQTVAITMVTANNDYSATTAAVTPDGTCSAGAELFWRFTVDGTGTNTDDGDARVISVFMEQAS